MASTWQAVITSPLGPLGIRTAAGRLQGIDFLTEGQALHDPADAVAEQVTAQLECYFQDPEWHFQLPVAQQGTAYQRRVWRALGNIPSGETRFYSEMAELLGSAARAIGGACRRNPIPIVVPCHRVVARRGLGGFAGAVEGINPERKRWLLAHEGITVK